MLHFKNKSGFTVLEMLITIGIMTILISMVLVGLNRFRSSSRDQEQLSILQNVIIGIQQYYAICQEFPASLDTSNSCLALDIQNKKITDIIPQIDMVTAQNSPLLEKIRYVGIDTAGDGLCSGYHIGIYLERSHDQAINTKDADFNSQLITTCAGSLGGFDGSDNLLFDKIEMGNSPF